MRRQSYMKRHKSLSFAFMSIDYFFDVKLLIVSGFISAELFETSFIVLGFFVHAAHKTQFKITFIKLIIAKRMFTWRSS